MAKKEKKTDAYSLLRKVFRIDIQKTKNNVKKLIPADLKKDLENDIKSKTSNPHKDRVKELYDYFLNSNVDSSDTLRNRFQRYNDLSFMRYNSNVIWRAIKMYSFEATQADSQNSVVTVMAKDRKVREYIYKFLQDIGYNKQLITDIAYNLALYGDSFNINVLEEREEDGKLAFTEVVPVSVYTIKDKMEFNAVKTEEELAKKGTGFTQLINRDKKLQMLADIVSQKSGDYGKFFKTYLFGYQISDQLLLPPWAVSHFRLFTTESEFYPYGRSLVLGSLSPWRQLTSLETLQQMARVYNFPTEFFSVKVDETMSEMEQWIAVNQARQEYMNINMSSSGNKEEQSFGKEIWGAQGLLDYRMESPNYNLNNVADMGMAMEKVVNSTDIPASFLTPNEAGSFGSSGISLTQQYKPFARSVYVIQNAILEEMANLIKLQFLVTGDFPEDTPFELEMKYPVLEESSDRQRAKSDSVRLVNDIISSLTDAIGLERGETLPPEVIIDIFSKYSFVDQVDIMKWADAIKDNGTGSEEQEEEKTRIDEKILDKIQNRLNEEIVLEAYFEARKSSYEFEGVKNGKHFVSSYHVNKKKCHDQVLEFFKPDYMEKQGKLLEQIKAEKGNVLD